ncbi:DDE-type integrase/transposase/recombinase [Nonomuraea bangladeshensis]|uniref:DDE-type integrase/transposase/recombinase n=1 Tax=Nonomuraea bangladeshensis TaxID=404385 RepID=UPI003C2B5712
MFNVYLRLVADDGDPESVTQALGVAPDESTRHGLPSPKTGRPYGFSSWTLALGRQVGSDQLEEVFGRLTAWGDRGAQTLRDLAGDRGWEAALIVVQEFRDAEEPREGIAIGADLIGRLAEARAGVEVDHCARNSPSRDWTPARIPSPGYLRQYHGRTVSRATISRYPTRHGLVAPEPKQRPRSSCIRFQAQMPNETWQADFTHYRLADGSDAEILSWLDDQSRYALSVAAHARVTGPTVRDTFRHAVKVHGVPASTLTDNGMVFTTRLAGSRGAHNTFEHELRRLYVRQKNSAPNHPTTCGKVERFQQTMKNWLRAQPRQPATLTGPADAARSLHRRLYTPSPAPILAAPRHPGSRLRRLVQGPARRQPRCRHLCPRPPRPHRCPQEWSPCAGTAGCTTSASDEPTPEPTSSS